MHGYHTLRAYRPESPYDKMQCGEGNCPQLFHVRFWIGVHDEDGRLIGALGRVRTQTCTKCGTVQHFPILFGSATAAQARVEELAARGIGAHPIIRLAYEGIPLHGQLPDDLLIEITEGDET